jgi:hypothetical protein
MKRDHLLGWPPALLALDPEPRKSQRTPPKAPIGAAEEYARAELDRKTTARLAAPEVTPEPIKPQAVGSKPDYVEIMINGIIWRQGDKPPHSGWWNAVKKEFAERNPRNAVENFSYWTGENWTFARHRDKLDVNDIPDVRPDQSIVVWREEQP